MTVKTFLDPSNWRAKQGHVPSIDGVRGTSIMMVLLGHLLLPVSFIGLSGLGLLTFFFISGFLITRLLLGEYKRTNQVSLRGFYFRRVLRLYPVLVVFVGVVVTVAGIRCQSFNNIDIAAVFLYFVNYLVIYNYHLHMHLSLPVAMMWSLSIEEHFYLFAPLILIALKYSTRRFAIWTIFVCIGSLALRLLYAHTTPQIVNGLELYWRSETRFDSIGYGVLLACLADLKAGQQIISRLVDRRVFITAIVLLALTFLHRDPYFQNTWRFTLQGILLMPIIAGVIFSNPLPFLNRFLNTPVMVKLGALSYSLYVWHGGMGFLFEPWLQQFSHRTGNWIEFILAFVFSIASYNLIERPIVDFRKKIRGRSRNQSAAIPPAI